MAKVSDYSSYRTMTAYEAVTAWKAKRKAMRQEFEEKQTAASNALMNASASKIDGMGTIAGQIALDRVIAEGKAKAEKQAALAKFATDDRCQQGRHPGFDLQRHHERHAR